MVPADINVLGQDGFTPLHRAIIDGGLEDLVQLLRDGADVEVLTWQGDNPLHLAAELGRADLLHLLIRPTTLNQQAELGYTPLQVALECVQHKVAAQLIAAGASLIAHGNTPCPLQLSMRHHYTAELALLVLNAMLADHSTPGLAAQAVRRTSNDPFDPYPTALHKAAFEGHPRLVARLVHAGADKDAVDKAGATPLWIAAAAGHAHLVPLLATPTNINLAGIGSSTPLWQAAAARRGGAVAALLAAGACADTYSQNGSSALSVALDDPGVVRQLLAALAKECKHLVEKKQEAGQQQGEAQQQQEQQSMLAGLVADAVVLHRSCGSLPHLAETFGMLLDVLGPGVVGEVCQVLRQHQEGDLTAPGGRSCNFWVTGTVDYLAEALLLGWVLAEERLHVARQPLVARLQRLVPGIVAAEQQQRLQQAQEGSQQPEGREEVAKQLVQLLKEAALAAAAGQQQDALCLLEQYAALHWQQHRQQQQHDVGQQRRADCRLGCPASSSSTQAMQQQQHQELSHRIAGFVRKGQLGELLKKGMDAAAEVRLGKEGRTRAQLSVREYRQARFLHPLGVFTTFLAAWVEARRQLQQLPQQVPVTVVAAVKAAQQQERQQQQQQQLQEEALEQAAPDGPAVPGPPAAP